MNVLLARLPLLVGSVVLILFGTAIPASAHPTLLSTDPEAGYSVGTAPKTVTMVFDEAVSVESRGVRLQEDRGHAVRTSEVRVEQDRRRLVISVLDDLGPGRYEVHWRVTAQDGDVVDASFDFAVAGSSASLRGRGQAVTADFPLVGLLRWLFLVSVVALLGGVVGERIARRTVPGAVVPRSIVRPAAFVGMLAVAGLVIQLIATTNGLGRAGYLLVAEIVGLAAIVALGNRARWWLLVPPGVLVIMAEALRNHVGGQRGVAGALLLAVHLAAVAVWLGALTHLLRVARANRGGTMDAFKLYSKLALWLVLVVAASGTVAALLLIPSLHALTGTTYGRTLIVKLVLVVAVVVLAWIGRRHLRRRPPSLPMATRAEAAIMIAVVGVTAVLVTLPTPAPATADLGYPTPATGPAIRLGTLAGQIEVGVTASENRLEIRLRVPDANNDLNEHRQPAYRVSGRVSPPGRPASTIPLQACGPGCFLGPVAWSNGTSYVDLRVETADWQGGAAVFPIRWVPTIARDVLPRVRAAMAAQTSLRLMESVTSDTSRPAPKAQAITVSGREFLESEPYGSPPDPPTVVLETVSGRQTIAFGLPAEGIYVELELDTSYRILSEKLTAPKHLTRRTFSYLQ